jgi:hypothetical protein
MRKKLSYILRSIVAIAKGDVMVEYQVTGLPATVSPYSPEEQAILDRFRAEATTPYLTPSFELFQRVNEIHQRHNPNHTGNLISRYDGWKRGNQ